MIRGKLIATIAAIATFVPVIASAAKTNEGIRATAVSDGPVTLSVSVDKSIAQVADPIQLVVKVEAPRGTRVQMPQLAKRLGDFEIRNTEKLRDIPSAEHPDKRFWAVRATLDTVKTGNLEVPSLDVHVAADAASPTFKTLHSKPIEIQITSVLENRADPAKFRDIKDTVDVAVPKDISHAWVMWTAGSLGVAAAVTLATLLVVRRKRGLSPAEWALAQIKDLRQLPTNDAADAESIYNELVDVVREFFELEFNVPTLSRTSREFLAQAANTVALGESPRKRLASLMSIADEIKFARYGVSEQQIRQALASAKAFVEECDQHRERMERMAG
jgi:hypothetical protein